MTIFLLLCCVCLVNMEVYLHVEANGLEVNFSYGETLENMTNIGGKQKLDAIADNQFNKFNGPGVGVYATSNGRASKNKASYEWFEYKENDGNR